MARPIRHDSRREPAVREPSASEEPITRLACAVLGVLTLAFGAWAFRSPRSFYDVVAPFEPYNRHFLHDAGAFSIGLAVALLLALRPLSAAVVALGAFVAAEVLHVLSHALDRDLGGRPVLDISFLALQAVVAVAVLVRRRSVRRDAR